MKKLHKTLLIGIILFLGNIYLHASENYSSGTILKDYRISVKALDTLSEGKNKISVKIRHNSHIVSNANVIFKLYQPDSKMVVYKSKVINDNGRYSFNVNLPQKGDYKYVLSFNKLGGVIRNTRGGFTLQ